MARRFLDTPMGPMLATSSLRGIRTLSFLDAPPTDQPNDPCPVLDLLKSELHEYFQNGLAAFSVPLDPKGTTFQQAVWHALLRIPRGATHSYTEVARAVGRPSAVRAVAKANADNPIAILIPCHRVIGSNGALTGYAGGLDRKRHLLQLESAQAVTSISPLFS